MIVVPGEPVAKPRQSRSDQWKQRPCVMRYRAWADVARLTAATAPGARFGVSCERMRFFFPLPASWSKSRREKSEGAPHRQKPDIDNLVKAVLDALLPGGDEMVWKIAAEKRWDDGRGPRVEIE